jgi:hypothetical protein
MNNSLIAKYSSCPKEDALKTTYYCLVLMISYKKI